MEEEPTKEKNVVEEKTEETEETTKSRETAGEETGEEVESEEAVIEETEEKMEIEEAGEETAEEIVLEEEEKERKPRFEEEELEDIVEERIYTIPLRRAWLVQPRRRAPKAIGIIKGFIQRHMKVGVRPEAGEEEFLEEEEKPRVIISNELNELIWRRGAEKPPRKVRVRAAKDKEGYVTVYPA